MARERTRESLLRRLADFVSRRRRREPVIDTKVTADDIRRAEELIEKHGLQFLREENDHR